MIERCAHFVCLCTLADLNMALAIGKTHVIYVDFKPGEASGICSSGPRKRPLPASKQPAAAAGKLCMSRVALRAAAAYMHACMRGTAGPQQQQRDIRQLPWGRCRTKSRARRSLASVEA